MKNALLTFVLAACCLTAFGRSAIDRWPALKSFHEVIAATFHPSQEGNLKPVKTQIDELCSRAETLTTAPMPSEYNNPQVQAAIAKLNKNAKELKALIVKKAPDAQIKMKLTTVHKCFHEIVDMTVKEE